MYVPIGAKVLLRELVYDRRSGIILPSGDSAPVIRCEVLSVGPGYLQEGGRYLPCQVVVGDHVYVPRVGTIEVEFNRYKYLMTDENRILVVIDKDRDKYELPIDTGKDVVDCISTVACPTVVVEPIVNLVH
jgi:co-chaperonin GroES (HSP10)